MKIRYGDIFTGSPGADGVRIIIHGCNAQGVMGSGIAATVKSKYPGAYNAYRVQTSAIAGNPNLLGMWSSYYDEKDNVLIVNAITQLNFGRDGRQYVSYEAVDAVFGQLAQMIETAEKEASKTKWGGHPVSIHFPLIGAGLGGGDWAIISQIISAQLEKCPIRVNHSLWIYDNFVN